MEGLERRAVVQDSLRGQAQVQPVLLPQNGAQGGAANAASVRAPVSSFDIEIGNQLGQFAQGKLAEAVKLKQEKSFLDGQMAYQQGRAFEDVEMGGDKWALEGYRVVQAQQLASGLLTAQQQEIAQGAYEMDPDAYRAHFMARAEGVLGSAPDQRTAELAREQLLRQMPVLVDNHMVANLEYKERMNFEELERSVDIISRDPTSVDQLIAFARGGEGTPTAALSDDRRRAATVSGVIRAFDNDNPLAYAALANEGLLGDNLTTDQINAVRSARQRFENRRRQEYNQELFVAEQGLMTDVTEGRLEPMAAVEALSTLYAEHGITMNAQEAGAVYQDARTGVRTAAITEGNLIDAAGARGDIDAQVDLVIGSLTRTESGGNSGAHRTNVDGRSFGGAMQFGQARLNDWAAATGSPSITVSQFTANPQLQREIERWHVRDIITHAQSNGYTDLVGTKINGVTVTLSGMVAVAHLGGKSGLDRFISSGGAYNPSDELGTSLTDYLRTHATGNADELFTPQQRMQRAIATRDQVIQRIAAEAQAAAQPSRDADDALFRNGIIDQTEWARRNRERAVQYGVERTTATVQHEAGIMSEVAVANINSAISEDERQRSLTYQLGVEEARGAFEAIAAQVSKGELPPTALAQASQQFFARTQELSTETGISIPEDEVLRDVRSISDRTVEATEASRVWHEEGVLIDQAVSSGTLGQLNPTLINRAVRAKEQELLQISEDLVARGEIPVEQQAQWVSAEQRRFLAQSGVVDSRMQRVINGYLAGGPIDRNGEPRPEYIEAVQAYRDLHAVNPALADRYIQPEYRSDIDAILHNAGDGPIEGAIRTLGVREADSAAERDPTEFIGSQRVQGALDSAVDDFLAEQDIGFWHSIWQGDADMSQMFDMTNTDRADIWSEDNQAVVRSELRYELEQAYRLNPRTRPTELIEAAARRVKDRTTVVAGEAIIVPRGTNLGEMFFGARAPEFTDQDGVYNTAIMNWLRSPAVQEQYPYLSETSFSEWLNPIVPNSIFGWQIQDPDTGSFSDAMDTAVTGVRPFTTRVHPTTGDMYIEVSRPEGGYYDTIVIPTNEVGQLYMQQHRERATR